MRELILAVQFLTRLPTPQLRDFDPAWLAGCGRWFAPVGALIGALLLLPWQPLAQVEPWLAAALTLLLWVWLTGALHLDGLADLADGLGAAHRDPARFLAVLKDPHVGSFGVVALVMALLLKLVGLMLAARHGLSPWALLLLPAWARFGALRWSVSLPPLASGGQAERFAWKSGPALLWLTLLGLLAISAWLAPWLCLAGPLALWLWRRFLLVRLGGVTGDCLGAGIECLETGLLLAGVGWQLSGAPACLVSLMG